MNALNPKELTPPPFQLEVKEAWLMLRPVRKVFFQFEVESTLITCAFALMANRVTQTIELTNDLIIFEFIV
jgi:hypothetical protein